MKLFVVAVLALLLIPTITFAQMTAGSAAPTPPMGWNSWDSFGQSISETDLRQTAQVVSRELKRFGWQYIVVDEGWYIQNPLAQPSDYQLVLTPDGRFTPDPARFPSSANGAGFAPLAAYVHSLGLKFGIHILRGIPRKAVESNMAIPGSGLRAPDAADVSDTCPWNNYNYGVRDNAAGQAYYDSILSLYASWGVDFLKVDCIANNPYKPTEIRMIHNAIQKTGRPIVLSLSPGPTAIEHASEVAQYAEMWRTCNDIWDHWGVWTGHEWSQGLLAQFDNAAKWAPYAGAGRWPDSDMLPLGDLEPHPGEGQPRKTLLTPDEQRTMFTLWSISRSPLMMGGNLLQLDAPTRNLLTNEEVINLNQHSKENRQQKRTADMVTWTARPETGGGYYMAVFNLGESDLKIDYLWAEMGLPNKRYSIRDLWTAKTTKGARGLHFTLSRHGSALFRLW